MYPSTRSGTRCRVGPITADDDLRRAKNEAMFREVNERVVELPRGRQFEVLCECGDSDCTETVRITLEEYEAVRAHPTAFVVIPGHENPDVDRVRSEGPDFLVVTKEGSAGDLARQHDPRR